MPEARDRERDLILGPGQYSNILDETKGHVSVYVGPAKASLSATDRPVRFDPDKRNFRACPLEDSIETFPLADKGSYIVLYNPAESEESIHPITGSNNLPRLKYGSKININGPNTFGLWPGQYAEVIAGHRLRSNQYLVIRIYDEEEANANRRTIEEVTDDNKDSKLIMGELIIVKGTDKSFYIPANGFEAILDENGNYVREAVTLERLEYCILLNEDGNKRYVQGPAVVFPETTEVFIEKSGKKKFKAIELNELMGIYVKVIANYEDGGKKYNVGDELFITGAEQKIYYPRPEHAVVKYGDDIITYAIAIPEGEARYVLNREAGNKVTELVGKVSGPQMFLPDPRKQVMVKRTLTPKQVELWFPGNQEALKYNVDLGEAQESTFQDETMTSAIFSKKTTKKKIEKEGLTSRNIVSQYRGENTDTYAALDAVDELQRGSKFTPPRTITLDTKYEGAVKIDVWPGFAVQVVKKNGNREVLSGPVVHLLGYDETLEVITLSTGTPKTDKKTLETVYLKVKHNTISDIVKVQTRDFCDVDVTMSYRVNFDGDPNKWFNVENYVKFLTDHLRSLIRGKVKHLSIKEFYENSIDIIRDTVLGEKNSETGKREGRMFSENGMIVYDIEILDVNIIDNEINKDIVNVERDNIRRRLKVESQKEELDAVVQIQDITKRIETLKNETVLNGIKLNSLEQEKKFELTMMVAKSDKELLLADAIKKAEKARIDLASEEELKKKRIELEQLENDSIISFEREKVAMLIEQMAAETDSVHDRVSAISPQLIAAIQTFGNKELAGSLAENFNVLKILGGGKDKSIVDMLVDLFGGTDILQTIGDKLQVHVHPKLPDIKG